MVCPCLAPVAAFAWPQLTAATAAAFGSAAVLRKKTKTKAPKKKTVSPKKKATPKKSSVPKRK